MLCVEDYLDALRWAQSHRRARRADRARRRAISRSSTASWQSSAGLGHLAADPATRSNTSVCLSIVDDGFRAMDGKAQAAFAKGMAAALEKEGVAYDIGAYRDAPPGLRIWAGATVEGCRSRGADAVARLGLRQPEGGAQGGRLRPSLRGGRRGPPRHPIPHRKEPRIAARSRFRQALTHRRADLQGSRRRGRLPARPRQGQGRACWPSSTSMTAWPSARPPRSPRS